MPSYYPPPNVAFGWRLWNGPSTWSPFFGECLMLPLTSYWVDFMSDAMRIRNVCFIELISRTHFGELFYPRQDFFARVVGVEMPSTHFLWDTGWSKINFTFSFRIISAIYIWRDRYWNFAHVVCGPYQPYVNRHVFFSLRCFVVSPPDIWALMILNFPARTHVTRCKYSRHISKRRRKHVELSDQNMCNLRRCLVCIMFQ